MKTKLSFVLVLTSLFFCAPHAFADDAQNSPQCSAEITKLLKAAGDNISKGDIKSGLQSYRSAIRLLPVFPPSPGLYQSTPHSTTDDRCADRILRNFDSHISVYIDKLYHHEKSQVSSSTCRSYLQTVNDIYAHYDLYSLQFYSLKEMAGNLRCPSIIQKIEALHEHAKKHEDDNEIFQVKFKVAEQSKTALKMAQTGNKSEAHSVFLQAAKQALRLDTVCVHNVGATTGTVAADMTSAGFGDEASDTLLKADDLLKRQSCSAGRMELVVMMKKAGFDEMANKVLDEIEEEVKKLPEDSQKLGYQPLEETAGLFLTCGRKEIADALFQKAFSFYTANNNISFFGLIGLAQSALQASAYDTAKKAMSRALIIAPKKIPGELIFGSFIFLAIDAADKNNPTLVKEAISFAKKITAANAAADYKGQYGEYRLLDLGYKQEYIAIEQILIQHAKDWDTARRIARELLDKGFKEEARLAYHKALSLIGQGKIGSILDEETMEDRKAGLYQYLAQEMLKDGFQSDAVKAYQKAVSSLMALKSTSPQDVERLTERIKESGLEGKIKIPEKLLALHASSFDSSYEGSLMRSECPRQVFNLAKKADNSIRRGNLKLALQSYRSAARLLSSKPSTDKCNDNACADHIGSVFRQSVRSFLEQKSRKNTSACGQCSKQKYRAAPAICNIYLHATKDISSRLNVLDRPHFLNNVLLSVYACPSIIKTLETFREHAQKEHDDNEIFSVARKAIEQSKTALKMAQAGNKSEARSVFLQAAKQALRLNTICIFSFGDVAGVVAADMASAGFGNEANDTLLKADDLLKRQNCSAGRMELVAMTKKAGFDEMANRVLDEIEEEVKKLPDDSQKLGYQPLGETAGLFFTCGRKEIADTLFQKAFSFYPANNGNSFRNLIDLAKSAIDAGAYDVAKKAMSRALTASMRLNKEESTCGYFISVAVEAARKHASASVKDAISFAKKARFSGVSSASSWGESELPDLGYKQDYIAIELMLVQHTNDASGFAKNLLNKGFKKEARMAYRKALSLIGRQKEERYLNLNSYSYQSLAEDMAKAGFQNDAIKAYQKAVSSIVTAKSDSPDILSSRVEELSKSIKENGLEGKIKIPKKLQQPKKSDGG